MFTFLLRDLMISRLMQEINELKRELARVKAEDGMLIESLHNRIKELEMELNELRQIAESTQVVSCIFIVNNFDIYLSSKTLFPV